MIFKRIGKGSKQRRSSADGYFEVLSLLFLGGTFLVALLAYIDRNKRK